MGKYKSKRRIRTKLRLNLNMVLIATLVYHLSNKMRLLCSDAHYMSSDLEFDGRFVLFVPMILSPFDNSVIFSKKNRKHVKNIDEVLTVLRQTGATLKLPKYHFFQRKTEYSGHIHMPGRLAAISYNVNEIKIAVFLTKSRQMKLFLSVCNVYRRFIKCFSKFTRPPNDYLRKDMELHW